MNKSFLAITAMMLSVVGITACVPHGVAISGYYAPFDVEGDYFFPCGSRDVAFVVVGGDDSLSGARKKAMNVSPPSIFIQARAINVPIPKWSQQAHPAGAYRIIDVSSTSMVKWPRGCSANSSLQPTRNRSAVSGG